MDEEVVKIEDTIFKNATNARYCYLCFSALDINKACTNQDCPLYGIPQE